MINTCPNSLDCDVVFTTERNDSGDPSTPYFSSWDVAVYNPGQSTHVPECRELTYEQIEQLENQENDRRARELDYGDLEP